MVEDAGEYPSPINITMLQQTLKSALDAMSMVLSSVGVSMTLDRIDIAPEDEPSAIDFVIRVRCDFKFTCDKLKEELERQLAGEEGGR